jgi:hypothetical protein
MIISPNCYLGRLPPSANGNNVGVEQNVIPPLNNKSEVVYFEFQTSMTTIEFYALRGHF